MKSSDAGEENELADGVKVILTGNERPRVREEGTAESMLTVVRRGKRGRERKKIRSGCKREKGSKRRRGTEGRLLPGIGPGHYCGANEKWAVEATRPREQTALRATGRSHPSS